MRCILVLLAVCVFAAAMVPRGRRALNSEELKQQQQASASGSPGNTTKTICAPQTPCAWTVYKQQNININEQINNTYCECSPDMACKVNEDDSAGYVYIHRCRPKTEDNEEDAES